MRGTDAGLTDNSTKGEARRTEPVKLRCVLDGLMLDAEFDPASGGLVVFDGDESFVMEALEAIYYELVAATPEELIQLQQARYRLLRFADDFRAIAG
jgi:hypothetical protein